MILWHKNYFKNKTLKNGAGQPVMIHIQSSFIGHPPIVKKISVKIPRKPMLEIQGRLTTSWILETDERCVKKM